MCMMNCCRKAFKNVFWWQASHKAITMPAGSTIPRGRSRCHGWQAVAARYAEAQKSRLRSTRSLREINPSLIP